MHRRAWMELCQKGTDLLAGQALRVDAQLWIPRHESIALGRRQGRADVGLGRRNHGAGQLAPSVLGCQPKASERTLDAVARDRGLQQAAPLGIRLRPAPGHRVAHVELIGQVWQHGRRHPINVMGDDRADVQIGNALGQRGQRNNVGVLGQRGLNQRFSHWPPPRSSLGCPRSQPIGGVSAPGRPAVPALPDRRPGRPAGVR